MSMLWVLYLLYFSAIQVACFRGRSKLEFSKFWHSKWRSFLLIQTLNLDFLAHQAQYYKRIVSLFVLLGHWLSAVTQNSSTHLQYTGTLLSFPNTFLLALHMPTVTHNKVHTTLHLQKIVIIKWQQSDLLFHNILYTSISPTIKHCTNGNLRLSPSDSMSHTIPILV